MEDGGEGNRSKNEVNQCINQGLGGKRTKAGSRKLTKIENNTVAFPHNLVRDQHIFNNFLSV